jgi:hypothetical protein
MRRTLIRAAAIATVALLAGCGGATSVVTKTVTAGHAATPTPSVGAQEQLGAAAGESLVLMFSAVRYPTSYALGQDFQCWAKAQCQGEATEPRTALSTTERSAAAGIVVAYSRELEHAGDLSHGSTSQLTATLDGFVPGLRAFLATAGASLQAQFVNDPAMQKAVGTQAGNIAVNGLKQKYGS